MAVAHPRATVRLRSEVSCLVLADASASMLAFINAKGTCDAIIRDGSVGGSTCQRARYSGASLREGGRRP